MMRWAGRDDDALTLAREGAGLFGFARWRAIYDEDPELWIAQLDAARPAQRWRRSLQKRSVVERELLHHVARSTVGFDLATALNAGVLELDVVRALRSSGWLALHERRVEVPRVRAPLLRAWTGEVEHADVLARYTRVRLAVPAPWTRDDTTCLAACVEVDGVEDALDDDELCALARRLRHTAHAAAGISILRRRLASERASTRLRRELGGALIDIGEFGASVAMLGDRSRASRVMRAHALMRVGAVDDGRRSLLRVGPGDDNWALQWALCRVKGAANDAEDLLLGELNAAQRVRHRGVLWSVFAELQDLRGGNAVAHYRRAVDDLNAAGDALGATYCAARLARALARDGARDEAADVAAEAWRQSDALPSKIVRGFAALAAVESGVASSETLGHALGAAARSEVPELAADALEATSALSSLDAPVLSIGERHALVDGAPLPLAARGPPWRIFRFLCELPRDAVVSIDEVFRAGWPGERLSGDSARRRVHTAVWTLRRAGLRDVLVTVGGDRYSLRARVIVDDQV